MALYYAITVNNFPIEIFYIKRFINQIITEFIAFCC